MADLNVLSLVEQKVPCTESVRRWLLFSRDIRSVRTHLDFVVDGVPLREHVRRWSGLDEPPDDVSRLTGFDPEGAVEQIDRLRGLAPHQYWGRAWLLFCSFCADEGCGGLTADLAIDGDQVVWSNFGWDTDYELDDDEEPVRIENSARFIFDRIQYDEVLLEARDRFIRPTGAIK